MALSAQPYKGARDFYPADKRLQKYLFGVWRRVCEQFGYEEYDAPILEPTDLYLAKGNEEIIKEQTYTFADRGKRSVTIRTEMTPTVSRMVAARRQQLNYPLRWYSIPNLWRYERPQRGRLREFWQLNVDLFGVTGVAAELEIITLVDAIFKTFGASADMYQIQLNNRQFTDYVLRDYLGLGESEAHAVAGLIDRMHKMERGDFITKVDAAIDSRAREAGVTEKLLDILDAENFKQLPPDLRAHESVQELQNMLTQLEAVGVTNAVFDATLMRGFDYYTGIVFEVADTHPDNNRAILGGGRYDGLVGLFGVEPVATVGFGWGDVPLANFLESHHLLPALSPETDIYIVLAGDTGAGASGVAAELRAAGLNVAVDLTGRKLGAQLKNADKTGIAWALIIGEEELAAKRFNLKNLSNGEEQSLSVQEIAEVVKGSQA